MIVEFAKSFDKSVKKINDKVAIRRLITLIEKLKKAKSLDEISNVTSLVHIPCLYRIRTGDYRLIVEEKERGGIEILLLEYLKRDDNTYRKYN